MRIEITPKNFQVRLYGDDPDNYLASFSYFKEADTAILYGLSGKGFYAAILPHIGELMERAQVKYVEATVLEWHAVLMEQKLKDVFHIERVRSLENAGRPMVWIRLSQK